MVRKKRKLIKEKIEKRYFCSVCKKVKKAEEIKYKCQINVSGRFPVWEYTCNECEEE